MITFSARTLFIVFSILLCYTRYESIAIGPYPLCEKYKDGYGVWRSVHVALPPFKDMPLANLSEVERHFFRGGPGLALNFSQIWLPTNCSYHRYTNETIYKCVEHILSLQKAANSTHAHQLHNSNKNSTTQELHPDKDLQPFRIVFFGDSGTRGLFCGLSRILSGSELYGPCSNAVCGTPHTRPASYQEIYQPQHADFYPHIRLVFVYIKSLYNSNAELHIAKTIKTKPYAVIINTGAWDFDDLARKQRNVTAGVTCGDNVAMKEISLRRASSEVKEKVIMLSNLAKNLNVKLIYRNNHLNSRFGALCADENFEKLLLNTNWELWDNRRISEKVWIEQNYDGFHYDRNRIHTFDHHVAHMKYFKDRGWISPGIMEIQLAQSLLHNLFYQCSASMYKEL